MRLKLLLINPWIHDFAAYNLWSRPLGLLNVAEYLSQFDVEIKMIDCTDSFTLKRYGSGRFNSEIIQKPPLLKDIPLFYKRYGISMDEFIIRVKEFAPFDCVLMTSIMSYWYPGVQYTINVIRDIVGNVPIILGGIYSTIYHEHASENSGADFIYKGHVDDSLSFALYTFGFKLKRKRKKIPYYHLGLYMQYPFVPLLTSTGCPFHCTYCASKILTQNYQRRSPESVLKEIIEYHHMGIHDIAFYDDALLVNVEDHIKPILKGVVDHKLNLRFHTPNGLHAKSIDDELARLMKEANFKTIRLSLETINPSRQKQTGGKVNNEDLRNAVIYLKQRGFTKQEIGVYLMYGLPGQDLEEVEEGIAFLKDLGVRINLTEFSPIKGTKAWNELLRKGVITDNLDPLLTNNSVFSYLYSDYNKEKLKAIKLDVNRYNLA
jgi:radical SAM superfamily enzyme YgiQ (UPF0313 family)